MGLIPSAANGAINDYANNAIQKVVNYGSNYLNGKLNYGLSYASNFVRQFDVIGVLPDQWSILDESGQKAFNFDTFVSADYKSESKVVQSPVEEGSFASYNMTTNPPEISCSLSKTGYSSDLTAFVDALQSYVTNTDLLTVVTPEREYTNMKLTKFNFTRSSDDGTDRIVADLSFQEVREVTSEYTSVTVQEKKQRGVQQSKSGSSSAGGKDKKQTSVLAGIKNRIKG